jgi:hypothetical protein
VVGVKGTSEGFGQERPEFLELSSFCCGSSGAMFLPKPESQLTKLDRAVLMPMEEKCS